MENAQLWLISCLSRFPSLLILLGCLCRGNLLETEVLFSAKCWDHRACDFYFSLFFCFSSGLKAEGEDKRPRRRIVMKLFCTHANTSFRSQWCKPDVHCLTLRKTNSSGVGQNMKASIKVLPKEGLAISNRNYVVGTMHSYQIESLQINPWLVEILFLNLLKFLRLHYYS